MGLTIAIYISDVSIFGRPVSPRTPFETQPPQGQLDCLVPTKAQEGSGGGDVEEEDQEDTQVPTRCRRSYPSGYHRQEESEAGSQESAEGTSHSVIK